MKLYYNVKTDQLGIAADDWDYVCWVKWVPCARISGLTWPDGGDNDEPIEYAEFQTAEPLTSDWEFVDYIVL